MDTTSTNYLKNMHINNIEIIDYDEEFIDWIIDEVIQKVYSFNNSKPSNHPLNINRTWSFKHQDLDVIYWVRYFHENSNLEMFPTFWNSTNIIEMSLCEFKRRMITKHKIKGDPVLVILTVNVEDDIKYSYDSLNVDNQIIL